MKCLCSSMSLLFNVSNDILSFFQNHFFKSSYSWLRFVLTHRLINRILPIIDEGDTHVDPILLMSILMTA